MGFPLKSKYLRNNIQQWNGGTESEREDMKKMMEGFEELLEWTKEEEVAFAKWMVAYLKYCGYLRPGLNPRFWKACMIQAFPRIMQGKTITEGVKLFKENPVPTWTREHAMMKSYMKVMKINDAVAQALSKIDASAFQ